MKAGGVYGGGEGVQKRVVYKMLIRINNGYLTAPASASDYKSYCHYCSLPVAAATTYLLLLLIPVPSR